MSTIRKMMAAAAAGAVSIVLTGAFAASAHAGGSSSPVEKPITKSQPPNSKRALTDQVLCPIDDLNVAESSTRVLGGQWLFPGESVRITADGSIWAGVWFTGTNGPNGWPNSRANSSFPLPGAPVYGMIGKLGNDPWRQLGTGPITLTNTSTNLMKKVVLRVNDSTPGNGSGAFQADVAYPCTGG